MDYGFSGEIIGWIDNTEVCNVKIVDFYILSPLLAAKIIFLE